MSSHNKSDLAVSEWSIYIDPIKAIEGYEEALIRNTKLIKGNPNAKLVWYNQGFKSCNRSRNGFKITGRFKCPSNISLNSICIKLDLYLEDNTRIYDTDVDYYNHDHEHHNDDHGGDEDFDNDGN